MPSQAALERGSRVAAAILQAHRDANGGAWPETVAVRRLTHGKPFSISQGSWNHPGHSSVSCGHLDLCERLTAGFLDVRMLAVCGEVGSSMACC